MEAIVEKPSLLDQQVALASLPLFAEAMVNKQAEGVRIQLQDSPRRGDSQSVVIPAKALHLLTIVLASMAQGKAIALIPADVALSTQQAADMLGVSRPHLVKLLDEGRIPCKKVGSHRRMVLEDLIAYEARQKEARKEQLQFLVSQAQELNLGYE